MTVSAWDGESGSARCAPWEHTFCVSCAQVTCQNAYKRLAILARDGEAAAPKTQTAPRQQ